MLIVVKKRLLAVIAAVLLLLGAGAGVTAAAHALSPKPVFTVVLDAGHGGIDHGVIGVESRVSESEINLIITQKVKIALEEQGIRVVLTRKDANGLYDHSDRSFKQQDMRARKEIILAAEPQAMVSIHCNKFPFADRRGAQVFFDSRSEAGILLAKTVQTNLNLLNTREVEKTYAALKGEYYMLKCNPYPSVIVECGFLSNAKDDALLNTSAYQEEVASAICAGIVSFLVNYY